MNEKRTHPNKVTGYLKPKNDALFRGFVAINEVSHSEAVNIIVKDFFNRLPNEQKMEYLSKARSRNTFT
jgi:hypothetical protein